jgi:hypothetical protein
MADADLYGLLTDDEPTAVEKTRALAQALAAQRANAQASRDFAGMYATLGSAGGKAQSQNLMGTADAQETQSATLGQQLLAALGQRQKRAHEAAELAQKTAHEGATEDIQRQALAQGRYMFANGADGGIRKLNTRTGEAELVGQGPPKGEGAGGLKPKDIEAEFGKLKEDVSTFKGRGNLNVKNQEALGRAEALEALLNVPDLNKITPQQLREAGTSLAGLISRGGSQALSQIEHVTPETMASNFANLKQKLLNEPQGADAQAFLQNILDTARREKQSISSLIHRGQVQPLANYAHLRKVDAARFDSILKGAGLDPTTIDENGLETQRAPQQSAGGASSALTTKTIGGKTYVKKPDGWHEVTNG